MALQVGRPDIICILVCLKTAVGLIRIHCFSKMIKTKTFSVVMIFLLVLWMIVIFVMSAQPAEQSSKTSDGLADKIVSVFYSDFDELSNSRQAEIMETATYVIRKTAHFLEYFVLGVLAFLVAVSFFKCKIYLCGLTSWIFCVLYSVGDEIHQYFVPGRACRVGDMAIDSAGGLTAILILAIIFIKNPKFREKIR